MRCSSMLILCTAIMSACNATPRGRCETAQVECLDQWTSTDVSNCITEWEILLEEAREADCSEPFQEWFNCIDEFSQCFTEERSDGTYTVWGLRDDDTVCDDEAEDYNRCVDADGPEPTAE